MPPTPDTAIVQFDATLDDVAEPSVRLYLRSPTYLTHRWRGAVLCALAFAALAFLGFNAKENVNLGVVCAAAAAWGAGIFVLSYPGTVRRRIKAHVAGRLDGSWPRVTSYEITRAALVATCGGVSTTYPLAQLVFVREDARRVEFNFGEKTLCVIPLRAFDSTDEKKAFLSALETTRASG